MERSRLVIIGALWGAVIWTSPVKAQTTVTVELDGIVFNVDGNQLEHGVSVNRCLYRWYVGQEWSAIEYVVLHVHVERLCERMALFVGHGDGDVSRTTGAGLCLEHHDGVFTIRKDVRSFDCHVDCRTAVYYGSIADGIAVRFAFDQDAKD